MFHRLWTLIRKELQSLLREPQTRAILILPVLIQVILFPFAATLEVTNATIAIYDEDNGEHSVELTQRFARASAFTHVLLLKSPQEIRPTIDTQKALLLVRFPADFSRKLDTFQTAPLQLILDGRNSNSAQIAANYLQQIVKNYQQELLEGYRARKAGTKGTLGLPLALGMYELLPFYATLFQELGYDTVVSPFSARDLYIKGQASIPSDTVCFPAKLMHGHIDWLVSSKVDRIFIPCSSYNINEEKGNNHFNCPVVAYYGEVIKGNQDLGGIPLTLGYLALDNPKHLARRISELFGVSRGEARKAIGKGSAALEDYRRKITAKALQIIEASRKEKRQIIVLAGRPYHTDPEINHGIDRMIVALGASVISEDSIAPLTAKGKDNVLNQWTYHARMYDAARYISGQKDMNLVQLVSFGCGLDAVTTDEVKDILRKNDRIYTQIKIDEITNLGAVKIRMRSLFAAIEMEEEEEKNGK